MDATRLPQGIIINSALTTARPVGTIVRDTVTGGLFISTNAAVATYSPVNGNVANIVASSATAGNASAATAYSNGTYIIPANSLRVGSVLKIRACSTLIGACAGGETMQLEAYVGAAGALTSLLGATPASTVQLDFHVLDLEVVIRAIGTAGAFIANALGASGATGVGGGGGSAGLLQTALNTTVANTITIAYNWSAAAADATSALLSFTVDQN